MKSFKCPHCHQTPISFREWGQGANAFRTICRSCGKKIKATVGTYIALIVSILVLISVLIYLEPFAKAIGLSHHSYKELVGYGLAVVVVGGLSFLCGYRKAE